MMLTYDRPEAANKVILRRRPSTDTWEVLSGPTHNGPVGHAHLCSGSSSESESDSSRESSVGCRHDDSLEEEPWPGGMASRDGARVADACARRRASQTVRLDTSAPLTNHKYSTRQKLALS